MDLSHDLTDVMSLHDSSCNPRQMPRCEKAFDLLMPRLQPEDRRVDDGHGKGFAVVAEAVRNLAQKSASSAKEIQKSHS